MARNSSLENLRQKLDSNNIVIVNQALSRLHEILLIKCPPGKKLINLENKVPELEFLWENCTNNCKIVANGSCSILKSLVVKGCADNFFVIKKLTNLALSSASLSNSSSIVEALCYLVTSEIALSSELPATYFNLRSPLHPLVRLLLERPDIWPIIFEHLKLLLPSNNESKLQCNLSFLAPVLQFILWDPTRNASFSTLRFMLLQHLVEASNSSHCKELGAFLYNCIFWLQVDSYENILESSWHLQKMTVVFQNLLYESQESVDVVLLAFTTLTLELLNFNMDISGCLEHASLLAKTMQETSATETTCATVVILSILLERSLPVHQSTIIQICSTLLHRGGINSVVLGVFFHPLILIVYSPCATSTKATSCLKQKALQLINFIQERLNIGFSEESPNVNLQISCSNGQHIHYEARNLCTQAAFAFQLARIADWMSKLPATIRDWLQHSQDVLLSSKQMIKSQLYLISSIFLHNLKDYETFEKCCEVLVDAAKTCNDLAPSIFIMMLHKLRTEKNPEKHLCLLNSIPCLGVHKLSLNIILPTLHHFMKVPLLQPFAIHLLSLLWQHQERVYPHLFEVIVNDKDDCMSSSTGINEVLVAKAAAILDICKLKPHLYGPDLLKILSNILLNNKNLSGVAPSLLAFDSIICLCKAEVIDLRTTWNVLSPVFNDDKRPFIIQKWCEFLSLAESLKLPTEDYEIFLNHAVTYLWQNVQIETYAGASFRALACFDITRHSVQHIPLQVRAKVDPIIKAASSLKKKNDSSEDDLTFFELGPYYVELLLQVSLVDLNDYGQFLQSVVCQEVRKLPRSALHFCESRAAPRGSKKRNDALERIPSYLIEKFDSNPPPSAIGNLALSLLLAFDPKVNTNRDGSVIPQSVLHCGKLYGSMLETLLFKATLDTSDWRKCNMIGFAWGRFMERLFFSMTNAHQAQINLQQRTARGEESNGGEGKQTLVANAWLWARDRICDTLKNATRSTLAVHGNVIIALAGLAAAVNKFAVLNVEKVTGDVETTDYLLHKSWMTDVLTTILNLLKPAANVQSRDGTFSWCYLAPGMPTNALQTYSAFSTVLLAPVLVHWDMDFITDLLFTITTLLQSSPQSSPIMQFSLGLSLGQLISQMSVENFTNVGEEAISLLLTNAHKLKQWCFQVEDGLSGRTGGILGLSMVASSFSKTKCHEFKDFILQVVRDLDQRAKSDLVVSSYKEVISVGRVLVGTSACGCGILSIDLVKDLCLELNEAGLGNSDDCGNATSYGLILQYLADTGDKHYIKLKDVQFENWIKSIKTGVTLTAVAAMNGLYSLFPICLESKFMPGFTVKTLEVTRSNSNLTDFIKSLSKDISFASFDMTVQNSSFWILGATYSCLTSEGDSISGEPLDYSYLENRSTLKTVTDFILQNIKSGLKPEMQKYIVISLKCFQQDAGQRFPPLNWSSLLTPFLFISSEIQEIAIGIAIAQARYSPSAASLLTSLMINNSFIQLEKCSQIKILQHLPKLICYLSTKSINIFLTKHISSVFSSKSGSDITASLVKGIFNALSGTNTSVISGILHLAVVDIFHHIDPCVTDVWDLFGKVAVKLPDEVQDQMTMIDTKNHDDILKILRLRTVIVGCRRRPLQWLNDCLEALAVMPLNNRDNYLSFIFDVYFSCFQKYNSVENSSEESKDVDSVNWIFELMGYIRSVIEGRSQLTIENENHTREVVSFLFVIFGLYITSLASKETGSDYFLWMHQKAALATIVPQILPTALLHLVATTYWKLHTKKFIHWFDFLLQNAVIGDDIKSSLKACLLHFRQCPELKTFNTWTHIIALGV